MKLTDCTAYTIRSPESHYGHGGVIFTFIKLRTDSGLVGWGECASQDTFQGSNWKAFKPLVDGIFEKFLKGEDPLEREKLLKRMYGRFSIYHPDFVSSCLFSAFDIALWDIAGKYYNAPVYQMLGGKIRSKIRSYTYIYTQPDMPTADGWRDKDCVLKHAKRFLDMGYNALKFDPVTMVTADGYPACPWDLRLDELHRCEDEIGALRNLVGPDVDILIGTHGQLTTSSAIRFGKMLEKYEVGWFEEPVNPENTKEMHRVAHAVSVPIATGERLAFSYEFQRLFEDEACAIAQPDLGSCGGLTEANKIRAMAEPKYIQMAPHCWGGPLILAAAIQLDTTIPNFMIQEAIDQGSDGWFGEIVDHPFVWEDGYFKPLEEPGIGINLVEEALEKYAAK